MKIKQKKEEKEKTKRKMVRQGQTRDPPSTRIIDEETRDPLKVNCHRNVAAFLTHANKISSFVQISP